MPQHTARTTPPPADEQLREWFARVLPKPCNRTAFKLSTYVSRRHVHTHQPAEVGAWLQSCGMAPQECAILGRVGPARKVVTALMQTRQKACPCAGKSEYDWSTVIRLATMNQQLIIDDRYLGASSDAHRRSQNSWNAASRVCSGINTWQEQHRFTLCYNELYPLYQQGGQARLLDAPFAWERQLQHGCRSTIGC